MSREARWLDDRVSVLRAALSELGMSVSRTAAAELITERVASVAGQLGVSEAAARRHLTDTVLTDLARTMAFTVAEETPGADVLTAPRTAAVPLPVLARGIAGLAEAVQVRLREHDDVEHLRTTVTQLAHALSAVGQVLADQPAAVTDDGVAVVGLPPGLVHRVARYLEAAATLVAAGVLPENFDPSHADQLAATFAEDAAHLRATARPAAPSPPQRGNGSGDARAG